MLFMGGIYLMSHRSGDVGPNHTARQEQKSFNHPLLSKGCLSSAWPSCPLGCYGQLLEAAVKEK